MVKDKCDVMYVSYKFYHLVNSQYFLDLRCAYCEMRYDVIGKVETFSEDFQYLEHISLLGRNKTHKPELLNPGRRGQITGLGQKYFATLDSRRRQGLYRLYKPDFDLFGYEAESYGIK